MIVDRAVLEADAQPDEILHRHDQINHLSDVLGPVTDGDPVDGALIHGPTGTGKIVTSRFITDRLERQAGQVEPVYVDSWRHEGGTAILHRVLDSIPGMRAPLHRSSPADELADRLRNGLDHPCVVILDECDQLPTRRSSTISLWGVPHYFTLCPTQSFVGAVSPNCSRTVSTFGAACI